MMKRALMTTVASLFVVVPTLAACSAAAEVASSNGRIVYGTFDPAVEAMHLRTVNPNGGQVKNLSVLSDPGADRWSPDGSTILITDLTGQSPLRPATVNADGSSFTRLGATGDPGLNLACHAWSPDGSRIACEGFAENERSRAGIYTLDAVDGGGLVRITSGIDLPGDFSPDGTRISFLRADPSRHLCDECGALFVVNTDGSGLHRLTPWGLASETGGRWSPDGRRILFERNGGKLYTVHPDGKRRRQIPLDNGPGRSLAFQPSWSPNGKRIVFSMIWSRNDDQEDLFTARADGRDLVQVTDTPAFDMFGFWRPPVD